MSTSFPPPATDPDGSVADNGASTIVADDPPARFDAASTGAPDPRGDAPESSEDSGSWRDQAPDYALGGLRVGIGAALVLAPGWAGRIWVGPGADGPGSMVFARALGARDVALGVRIISGVRRGEPVGHWIASGFVADAADVVAAMIAAKHLTPGRRVAIPLVAGAVGALGVWSTRRHGDQ